MDVSNHISIEMKSLRMFIFASTTDISKDETSQVHPAD